MDERLALNQQVIDDFRAHGGAATIGRFVGTPLLLLTTIGARSGRERTTPLAYTRADAHYVVLASNGGSDHHPAWFYNLLGQPLVSVEVGTEQFQARASVAVEPARSRLYAAQADLMPNFARHARSTRRTIPVIVLERLSP